MTVKMAQVVNEVLASGYQLHPQAFEFLDDLPDKVDIIELVKKAIQAKKKRGDQGSILMKDDLEEVLPPELKEEVRPIMVVPPTEEVRAEYEVVKDPTHQLSPMEGLRGFQELFKSRFEKLMKIVRQRPDAYQIRRTAELKKAPSTIHKIAGLVLKKQARRGHVELTIDDESGKIDLMVMDEKVKREAIELCLDQLAIIDLQFSGRGLAIAKGVYSPDIPDRVVSRSKKVVYAVFTSDLHVGSKTFLLDAFNRFTLWLRGEMGDSLIVRRIKYLIIGGDAVDGVGVYPDQEKELEERDIHKQYEKVANLIEKVPKHIQVFIIPGNHDPVRQALPQPAILKEYAHWFSSMENVIMLGNPCSLKLHGVNVLVYHGRSLDDVVATIPGLTFSKPASAMRVLLKARHLAPIYGGRTSIAPEVEDHLVIEEVPDIFHAGHVHAIDVSTYRGTMMVNSGTWQGQTGYQARMGISPTPGLVPVVNLATLDLSLKDFTS